MKHLFYLLLFFGYSLLSSAQCSELKATLNQQPIPEKISEWAVTIKERNNGLFEMTVQLERIKETSTSKIQYSFTYSHYGFEVVDCVQCSEIKNTALTFAPFDFKKEKKELKSTKKVITLRKIQGASLYHIKGVGKTAILHYKQSCGCSIEYHKSILVLHEDPSPKTIIIEHPLMTFEKPAGTINCYPLH